MLAAIAGPDANQSTAMIRHVKQSRGIADIVFLKMRASPSIEIPWSMDN